MELAEIVLARLAKVIDSPETELHYENPFQLLIAVILSAQCTDKRVNMVTPDLFERFPSATSLASADFDTVFSYIRSISYPNNKAKHLINMAQMLVEHHKGEVPRDYDDLLKLPGVGRKTANVIASVVYKEARMAVDTHVFRLSNRIGIAEGKNVLEVEKKLMEVIPEEQVADAHHYLILHGRYTCIARKPKCSDCNLTDICKYYRENKG
ncbi:MAG: endonuclease III [Bacteroidia bacterium]